MEIKSNFKSIVFKINISFFCFCIFLFSFSLLNATTYYALTNNGNWTTPGTWSTITCGGAASGAGYPGSVVGDVAIICNGITVVANATPANALTTLTMQGSGTINLSSAFTITVTGTLTMDGTSLIYGLASGATGNIVVNNTGSFIVPATATLATFQDINVTINCASTLSGALYIKDNNGTNTFSATTINSAGELDNTTKAASIDFQNNSITLYGSIAKNSTKTIVLNNISSMNVPAGATATIYASSYTVTGTLTLDGELDVHSGSGTKAVGSVVMDNGSTWQTFNNETYVVNNNFTMNTTSSIIGNGATSTFNIAGQLTINNGSGSGCNCADVERSTMNVTGLFQINANFQFSTSTSGTHNFYGGITNTATGTFSNPIGESYSIGGNLLNNGTWNASGTGAETVTFTPLISGSVGYSISGNSVTVGNLKVSNNGGTTTLTNNVLPLTINITLSGLGTFVNGANATVYIGKNSSGVGAFTATAVPNTVVYNGTGNQTAYPANYYNLTINNSGAGNTVAFSTANMNIANLLYIQQGDMNFSSTGFGVTGNNLTMDAGTRLRIATDNTIATVPQLTGVYTLATNSSIRFSSTNSQNVFGIVGSNSAHYQNVEFTGASTTKAIQGDLYTDGNLLIDNSAILNTNSHDIYLKGNWTNNSTSADPLTEGVQTITLNGTTTQTITNTGSATGTVFNNLVVNNTYTATPQISLAASTNVTVGGTLTMTSGNVNLNSNTLTLGTGLATPGTLSYTTGFLFGGTFTRWISATAASIGGIGSNELGHFPMGTSVGDYRPLWITYSSNLTTGGTVSVVHAPVYPVNYVATSYTDATWTPPVGGTVLKGTSNSSWIVSEANSFALSGSTGIMRLGGQSLGTFVLADINLSLAASSVGTFAAATSSAVPLEVNRIALADFANTFYVGTDSLSASPLPVELLSFNAQPDGNAVNVTWQTASEKNCDYFTVEKSQDGNSFIEVAQVKGAGNSNVLRNYESVDADPLPGLSYYRLNEMDFNDASYLSNIVAVNFDLDNSFSMNVYPNITSSISNVNVQLKGKQNTNVLLVLTDMLGREYYSKMLLLKNGNYLFSFDKSAAIPSGIYFITASSDEHFLNKKIVIK